MKKHRSVLFSILSVFIVCVSLLGPAYNISPDNVPSNPILPRPEPPRSVGIKFPLVFESNVGQAPLEVKYLAHGAGYDLYITEHELVVVARVASTANRTATGKYPTGYTSPVPISKISPRDNVGFRDFHPQILRIRFSGRLDTPAFHPIEPMSGRANYFIRNDPKHWHTNIPVFGRVIEHNVWPGIDLAWYGNQGRLECDFIVTPIAKASQIQFTVDEKPNPRVDVKGNLLVGLLELMKPTVYQQFGGQRRLVNCRYSISQKGHLPARVRFEIASYDHARSLVIDPSVKLAYSTYLGGSGIDAVFNVGNGIAVDAQGSAYVTGWTLSQNFPLRYPFEGTPVPPGGDFQETVFVTKFTPNGNGLIYSTYLGGFGTWGDQANGIAVDSNGYAYITGTTGSNNFPLVNAFQTQNRGYGVTTQVPFTAFLTKLSADGSALIYSTYLGGSGTDGGYGVAVDSNQNAYVVGWTKSTDFPTKNSFQGQYNACGNGDCLGATDAFITKFSFDGRSLVYSTYLGGTVTGPGDVFLTSGTSVGGIAVDSKGSAYLTGYTNTPNFPTQNPFQNSLGGTANDVVNAFVSKLSPDGSSLVYSTYLGGNYWDFGDGIAVDSAGSAYIAGQALSSDFPVHKSLSSFAKVTIQRCIRGQVHAGWQLLDLLHLSRRLIS